ncbi:MAG: prepilin-type N-terminal cleavage/methylation domain-containing protein [Oscillospiraceae bacterium]|nr:prepilin-type N-terminal cleavage/methylation domain-containing protein [Oscillospiraceae bacterium]
MKKQNQKGFTLAELLIVVAIIAVLVAIAIPVFTQRLEASRETTDIANLRSAYAAAQVADLSGIVSGGVNVPPVAGKAYYFNPNDEDGLVETVASGLKGQGTATNGHADTSKLPTGVTYNLQQDVRKETIKILFNENGLSSIGFTTSGGSGS